TRWPRDWSSDVCSSDLGFRDRGARRCFAAYVGLTANRPIVDLQGSPDEICSRCEKQHNRESEGDEQAVDELIDWHRVLLLRYKRSEERRVGKERIDG